MKVLSLFNWVNCEARLMPEIQDAVDWLGALEICSVPDFELNETISKALVDMIEAIKSQVNNPNRTVTLNFMTSVYNSRQDALIRVAGPILEKICLDDCRLVPIIVDCMANSKEHGVKELSLSACDSSWDEHLPRLCEALKNECNTLKSLRIRTWTYGRADLRTLVQYSWEGGLALLLEAITGKQSLTRLKLEVLSFSENEAESLVALLLHPACRLENIGLCLCHAVNQVNSIDSILPGLRQAASLKCIHLSGWEYSAEQALRLLDVFRKSSRSTQHNNMVEGIKLDRSRLSFHPNQEHFFNQLLQMKTLKYLSTYAGEGDGRLHWSRQICLDLELLLPSLAQSTSLECLTLEHMNVSRNTASQLLQLLTNLPNLKFLKIVNLPQYSTMLTDDDDEQGDEPPRIPEQATNLRQLILVGIPPFVANHRNADYDIRSQWYHKMLCRNPQLHSFGPGQHGLIRNHHGLARFLPHSVISPEILHLADYNQFGRGMIGQVPLTLWPVVLARVNERLHEFSDRQASVIYSLLVAGLLISPPISSAVNII